MSTLVIAGVGVLAVAASISDVRTRRIPNVLTFGAAGVALVVHLIDRGWSGAGFALGGWGIGLLAFLPFFVLRGLGAGDVKLMAAVGAWLGPASVVWAALFSAMAGGVLALAVALAHGYLKTAYTNMLALVGFWRVAGPRPYAGLTLEGAAGPRLPYALAIATGTMVTLWLH